MRDLPGVGMPLQVELGGGENQEGSNAQGGILTMQPPNSCSIQVSISAIMKTYATLMGSFLSGGRALSDGENGWLVGPPRGNS